MRGATLAVVLAAGDGSRFLGSSPKLLAPLSGRPLVAWAIDAARASHIGEVVVVTGAVDLGELTAGCTVIRNPDWEQGQATSLRVALDYARSLAVPPLAIVVGLGDQPLIDPSAWQAVAASRSPIAVASYGDRRRNPVRLSSEVWDSLDTRGDEGARALMRLRPELVEAVPCVGEPIDVDTVDDLAAVELMRSTATTWK
jgi:molybdenum cofactor cytidylyltransferase